jgi:hypothetical protein
MHHQPCGSPLGFAVALGLGVSCALAPAVAATTAGQEREAAAAPAGAADIAPEPPDGASAEADAATPTPAPGPRHEALSVDLRVDLPVMIAAGALAAGLQLVSDDIVRSRCTPSCTVGEMNGLDRPVAGRYVPAAATASDVLLAVNLGLPVALDLLELGLGEHPDGWTGWGEDTLILGETLALNAAAQSLTAFAVQRPRPFAYGEDAPLDKRTAPNAYLSFYSGHTSNSFAAATAYAYLFGVRHPSSPWRAAVWVLGEGLAAMDGCLRVTAGYHFPSDVLVGAAVGTAIGVVVPWLHTSVVSAEPAPGDADATAHVRWLLLPSVTPDSAGLSVLVR